MSPAAPPGATLAVTQASSYALHAIDASIFRIPFFFLWLYLDWFIKPDSYNPCILYEYRKQREVKVGLCFERRITIFTGFPLNAGLRGTGLSIGPRGASITLGRHGAHARVGLPGTDISSRTRLAPGRTDGRQVCSGAGVGGSRSRAARRSLDADGRVAVSTDGIHGAPSRGAGTYFRPVLRMAFSARPWKKSGGIQ